MQIYDHNSKNYRKKAMSWEESGRAREAERWRKTAKHGRDSRGREWEL
jgi:hypothetical protein